MENTLHWAVLVEGARKILQPGREIDGSSHKLENVEELQNSLKPVKLGMRPHVTKAGLGFAAVMFGALYPSLHCTVSQFRFTQAAGARWRRG